jgi:hypothetical protein
MRCMRQKMDSSETDRWGHFTKLCRPPGFSRIRFGVLLLLIGALWLAGRTGFIDLQILGPAIVIFVGLWIIFWTSLKKMLEKER